MKSDRERKPKLSIENGIMKLMKMLKLFCWDDLTNI